MANDSSIDYKALEADRVNKSKAALKEKLKNQTGADLGRAGSLRRVILGFVVAERYDEGKAELLAHVERKRQYPNFQSRVERFVQHATELIGAIQTKRSFPGLTSLSLSKQQEIVEKVLHHFEELKQTLKTIERAEKDVRLEDLRTTSWVVSTFAHCLVLIAITAFLTSINAGHVDAFTTVFNALVDDVVHSVAGLMHWKLG